MTHEHKDEAPIKTPLWKWIIFILIAIMMPLLFALNRSSQIHRAIVQSEQGNPAQ